MSETKSRTATSRPQRTPVGGSRNRLSVTNKDPDFEYRWVNDEDDRIQELQERGYEICQLSDHKLSYKARVDIATPTDNMLSVGGGMKSVLMKIRKDWHQEDQAAKQKIVDEREEGLKPKSRPDIDYGTLNATVLK